MGGLPPWFGPFQLDIHSGELRKGPTRLRVADQSIEILKALLEHPGELVTREQLRERLWPSNTFVDFEHGLNAAIRRLREALGDSADAPKFVETVPRRGYRFIAPVEGKSMLGSEAPTAVAAPLPPTASDSAHLAQPESAARSPLRLRGLQLQYVALGASIAVALGIGVWVGSRGHATTSTRMAIGRSVPITSFPGLEIDPALSPDGNQVAFAAESEQGDNLDIYVKLIDGGAPLRLTTDAATDRSPAWSPDGGRIAFVRATGVLRAAIMIVPALGGPERRLIEIDAREKGPLWANWISWTPDGSAILYADHDGSSTKFAIFMCSLDRGQRHQLTRPTRDFEDQAPVMSPDGRQLGFVRRIQGFAIGSVFVQPLEGLHPVGEPRRVTQDDRTSTLARSHDGTSIFYDFYDSGGRDETGIWRVPVEGGRPEPILSNVRASRPVVSRDGKRLVYQITTTDLNIWRMPGPGNQDPGASTSPPVRVVASTFFDMSPQFSPDGKQIAFVSYRSGNAEIWISSSDGAQPTQLTTFGGPYLGSPRWSPDGEAIVFDSRRSGSWNIYVVGVRDGRVRNVTQERSGGVRPSWSRDGRWIYFGSARSGDLQLWKVAASAGAAIQITRNGGMEAFESPDGKHLYYVKAAGASGIWQVPVDGGEEVRVTEHGQQMFWSMTDRGILLVNLFAGSEQTTEFFSFELKRLVPVVRPLPKLPRFGSSPAFAASRDGRWILYAQYDEWGSDIHMLEGAW